MRRIDLIKQRNNVWCEIEEIKKIRTNEKDKRKTYQLTQKINRLKIKYDFFNNLLEASR